MANELQAFVDETFIACEGNDEIVKRTIRERCITDPAFLELYLDYTWVHAAAELLNNTWKHARKAIFTYALVRGEHPTTGADIQRVPRDQWAKVSAQHTAQAVAALRAEIHPENG